MGAGPSSYTVTVTDIEPLVEYAEKLWERGNSPKHDFDSRADTRSKEKYVSDHIEGKVGERAFAKFLENRFGIEASVELDIFDSIEETDFADLKTIGGKKPACSFDVKTTKKSNSWLAIRESIWKEHDDDDPFIMVLVNPDECVPGADEITVRIVGWVEASDFDIRIARGKRLYSLKTGKEIGPTLKTDNRCIPIQDIPRRSESAWESFVRRRLLRDEE